ncbi:suppressor of fused domain protein [Arenimonas metalli]|uniref:Suppressor of fused-like domain-containing protein n=1 Tax=Arenimonas metalli CF5-1 TaxID=1384056 RepID=A0A091B272_9GAMM|nr:suppressor of fused domain protein [Arenimonas metalli]KFN46718.1 hypothetical protein N787_09385 [Arenimonas metalli CF5-1]
MAESHDLESVWELREEILYPAIFGPHGRGIFVLSQSDFASFGADSIDPRWLHLGVFEFAPTEQRRTWLYVTSGGSTPWEQEPAEYSPDAESWLGVEFLIESTVQGDWAIRLLCRLFALHVLAEHGRFGDRRGLNFGSRVPVGAPIDGEGSALTCVVTVPPSCVAPSQCLPSGTFEFRQLVGVTASEAAFAKQHGYGALMERLGRANVGSVTDPGRAEVEV